MLTQEEHVELNALVKRRWSVSAIARHLGRDRKTVRAYINGERQPGERRKPTGQVDPFDRIEEYVAARLREDPHVWASALYDEVGALGYQHSYVSFARQIRQRRLRPHCPACAGLRAHPTIEIPHEPGEEIQWDWLEFEQTPWGEKAHLFNGTLPFSGRTRGVFADAEDQAHLVEAIDGVLRRLGGTARRWRFDRMATVVEVGTGRLLTTFAEVAKYYSVAVDICPSRRAQRKGAVEKHNHFSAQRWWRTAAVRTKEEAQAAYDRFQQTIGDGRRRGALTVAELAAQESLMALPSLPYPATVEVERLVRDSATVAFRGNLYRVAPGLVGSRLKVRYRLGTTSISIVSPAGGLLLEHQLQPDGCGVISELPGQHHALETAVLAAFNTQPPCRRKENRPPGPMALAAARKLLDAPDAQVTVDLARYAELVGVQP
jgi:transposase